MSVGWRSGGRRWAAAALAACLAGVGAVPAAAVQDDRVVASLPPAGAWLDGDADPLPRAFEGSARRASLALARRADHEGDDRQPFDIGEPGVARHAGVEDRFVDTCEDAGGAPDLRRATFSYDFDDEELTTTITTCGDPLPQLVDGAVAILMGDDDTSVPQRRVLVFRDDDGLAATLFDARGTAATDDDTEILTVGVLGPDVAGLNSVRFRFDGAALEPLVSRCRGFVPAGSASACFSFAIATTGDGDGTDTLPEPDEPLLVFPDSCDGELFDHATVRVAEGQRDRAEAAAVARGLAVRARSADALALAGLRGDVGLLADLPGVVAVDATRAVTRHLLPDDDGYDEQWQHAIVDTPSAWDVTTGSPAVRVAIIDDGVDATRHDLRGRVGAGQDTVRDVALPAGIDSDRGAHGTQVAGLLAATGDNGGGPEGSDVAGVDWGATIVPVRIFDAAGCATDADVAAGIDASVDLGAHVVNLSLGTTVDSPVLRSAVARAEERGAILLASTGNDGRGSNLVNYPAAYDSVVAVGASTSGRGGTPESVAGYSNTASDTFVIAPGGDGTFRVPSETELLTLGEDDWFVYVSGTSFSTPLVAGAVSLLHAVDRCLTPQEVRDALAATSVPIAGDTSPRLADGRRRDSGHGRIDVLALLDAPGVGRSRPPEADDLRTPVAAGTARTFALPVQGCAPDASLTVTITDPPTEGTLALDGTTVTYTPDGDAAGQDRFSYEASVPGGATAGGTVTLDLQDQVRLRDADRYATAAVVSGFAFTPGVDVVYVASGAGFPDALSASAAAGARAGPVLLTRPDRLPDATARELLRLAPREIVVVGGPAAVHDGVAATLAAYAGEGGVRRLSGPDRFGTAVDVSRDTFPDGVDRVYVATGFAFPDALAGAPPAILGGAPLLLTRTDTVPAGIALELERLDPDEVVVLGGPAAIAPATAAALGEAAGGATVTRLAAEDRYGTGAAISAARFPGSPGVVFVATGEAFPDALAGGVAAARLAAPLLLVPTQGAVPAAVLAELDRLDPDAVVVLGGDAAVSPSVAAQLRP